MTNREYFKDPDDQCQMFLLEHCWGEGTTILLFENDKKLKWLKSEVSHLAKNMPRCPICGKLPKENHDGFLVCPSSECVFNKIQLGEAADTWRRRCTNGN